MDAKGRKLGGSLAVPNVQELAKQPLSKVPSRYVRLDQDHNVIPSLSSQVPVIDMKRLSSKDSFDSELKKLHLACKDWGFFQIINHRVSSELLEKVKEEIKEFFKLSMEEKKKYMPEDGDVEGYGQAFVVSEDQKLDWGDRFSVITLPHHLRKPHLFPQLPLPLRETLEEYSREVKNITLDTLIFMAKALNMEIGDFKVLFDEGMQSMRMNYYPPCPQPEQVVGITPHTDGGGITFLLQINDVEGLQIKKDGLWIPIKPLPNAFVVNIGDMLEVVTNGLYKSIEHRATVNSDKERLSIATFLSPKLDGDLGPAPSLLSPQTPPIFPRVTVVDFFKTFLSMKLEAKSTIEHYRF